MEWTITADDLASHDVTGVENLITRMESELRGAGSPIEEFRFLNSTKEMLKFSREIEAEVQGNPTVADLCMWAFRRPTDSKENCDATVGSERPGCDWPHTARAPCRNS